MQFCSKNKQHNHPKFNSKRPCKYSEECKMHNCAFKHQERTSYSPLWCDSKLDLDTHVNRKHAKLVNQRIPRKSQHSAEDLVNQVDIPQRQQQQF